MCKKGGFLMDIGKRLKQLRVKNNLTLEELASRSELTKGYLSQLERNLSSPSIVTLEDICEALGTRLSEFFLEEEDEKVIFTKKDAFVDEQDSYITHWIVPNAQKNLMEPIVLELLPKSKSKNISPHEGEELGYVLQGRVVLCRENDPKGKLVNKGETFYIKGNEAHYLENRTNKTVKVLWISTPPIF